MAAVITLSSFALASDGVTLTATIGGGTAPYSITSAAGLVAHLSGTNPSKVVPTATPAVSGTTLTITLPTPFLSGQTVQFDLTAASTLTDSAANTVVAASNTAVTNSSTATGASTTIETNLSKFNFNGAAVVISGSGVGGLNAYLSKESTTDNTGYGCEWVINVTSGTVSLDVECSLGSSSNTLIWAIDNGAAQSYVGNNVGFQLIRVATGLGVGKHVIRHNLPNNFYTRSVRIVTTSGAATIVTVPCPVAMLQDNVTGLTVASAVSPVARWGTMHVQGGAGGSYINNTHVGFQINIAGNFQGVDVLSIVTSFAISYAVAVDQSPGAAISAYTSKSYTGDAGINNSYQMTPLAAGLSAGAHTVEMLDQGVQAFKAVRAWNGSALSSAATAGTNTISVADVTNIAVGDWLDLDFIQNEELVNVTAISGTGPYTLTLAANLAKSHVSGTRARNFTPANTPTLTTATKPTFAGRLVVLGDSISHSSAQQPTGGIPAGYIQYDPRASYAFMVARAAGYECVSGATQGWTSTNLKNDNGATNSDAGKPATFYCILIGTNDFGAGNTPLATYESNLETVIGQCKTAAPSGAKIVVAKIFSATNLTTNATTGLTKVDYNNQQATAVTNTQATGFTILQIDFARSLNKGTATTDIPDSTHPSVSGTTPSASGGGQNKIANELMPHVLGYTLTLASSSGPVGTPVTVTVALNGGATFVSGTASATLTAIADTITLSDGGAGGSFGTLTLTPGSNSASTTYTPATAGTATISATNGQGWANPSGQSFTATGGAFSGTAAFTGSGSLAAAGDPSFPVASGFSGSGSLTVAGTATPTAAPAFTGSGTLTAAGTPAVTQTAAFTGAGTLTAAATPAVSQAATFTGDGTLAVIAQLGFTVAVAFTGDGTLVASPIQLTPTPPERIYVVRAETRVYTVPAESRIWKVT